MKLKNPTDMTLRIEQLGLEIAPGDTIEIEDAYCLPRVTANGRTQEATIRLLAPHLIPADQKLVKGFLDGTLDPVQPAPTTVGTGYADVAGLPPAARALVEDGQAASVPPKPAKSAPTEKQKAAAHAEALKKMPNPE